ncbi:MAG: cytochrome c, partial [Pseudohongiellaceae bacterium]
MKARVVGKWLGLALFMAAAGLVQAQGDAAAGQDKIMVCLACHGESGNESLLPDVPRIGGQNESYLLKQMIEIKSGVREIPLMNGMLNNLDEQDMADVAAWYASQDAPSGAADPELLTLGEKIYRAGIA